MATDRLFISDLTVDSISSSNTSDPNIIKGINVGSGAPLVRDNLDGEINIRTLQAGSGVTVTTIGDVTQISSSALAPTNPSIGSGSSAAPDASAYGVDAIASQSGSLALGTGANATGVNSVSIGSDSINPINDTINMSGGMLIRNTTGVSPTDAYKFWAGGMTSYGTQIISLTTTGMYAINIPTGARFYPMMAMIINIVAPNVPNAPAVIGFGNNSGGTTYGTMTTDGTTRMVSLFDLNLPATQLRVTVNTSNVGAGSCRVLWLGVLVQTE